MQQVIKDFQRSLAFFFDVSRKSSNFGCQKQPFEQQSAHRLLKGLERKDLWGQALRPSGIRIAVSGGLSRKGAKAKTLWKQAGAVPTHVFDQPVDFSVGAASTRLGEVGIRVLICYELDTVNYLGS